MMIKRCFARLSGKPQPGLGYECMHVHYLFSCVKAFCQCRKKLNILDIAQLIVAIPLVACGKEEKFLEFMRKLLLKHHWQWLWPEHWTYQSDYEKWAKQNPVMGEYITKKEKNFTKLFEIKLAALTRLTEEQATWLGARFEQGYKKRKEERAKKKKKKVRNNVKY